MKAAISAVAALALALLPTAALANLDGALDTTLHPSLGGFPYFGVPGLLDYAIDYGGAAPDTNNDYASAVLPLPDGRFYVAGQSWSAGNPLSSHVGVLERFLADGSVDATFGTNGRVLFGGGGMTDCYITSIALQGNKPLIAQSYRLTGSPSVEYTRLTRLDTDGTLDRILIGPDEAPIPNEGLAKVITDAAGDMYVAAHFNHAQGTRFEVIFASGDAGPGNESSFNFALGSGAQDAKTRHATQKPVECMRRPIENNSSPGQAIYDPFSGSGTTIIAAEMTGRSCLAIDIDPAYVDVSVLRWQAFTGEDARLDQDRRSFTEVAAERGGEVAC